MILKNRPGYSALPIAMENTLYAELGIISISMISICKASLADVSTIVGYIQKKAEFDRQLGCFEGKLGTTLETCQSYPVGERNTQIPPDQRLATRSASEPKSECSKALFEAEGFTSPWRTATGCAQMDALVFD